MSYTAQQLISRAWYLSGIVSRSLQTPTGSQISEGLEMLNSLLNFKQIDTDLIPYYTYIEMPLVAGEEFYFLPYVASVESATFNIDVIRYPMQSTTRRNYYASARTDNISSLPFNWNFNRSLGGGNLAVYFKPDSDYALKMMVKLFLVDVELTTDMTNVSETVPYTFINSANQGYDTGYLEYLRYSLARYMCSEYGILFNPQSEQILNAMERELMYVSPPDLSNKKASILNANRNNGMTYAQVSIGQGWSPS